MSPDRRKSRVMMVIGLRCMAVSAAGQWPVRRPVTRRMPAALQGGAVSRPSWNIARPVTGCRGRVISDTFRCRVWQDSSRNTSKLKRAFIDAGGRTRSSSTSRSAEPVDATAMATHFRGLNSKPFGGAPRGSLGLGKKIYEEGLPESNVPACSACHGTEGKGQNEIPRLAGQVYAYTVGQLTGWNKNRGQGSAVDTSAIMAPTAHNLTRSQVDAVAAYVSYLQ